MACDTLSRDACSLSGAVTSIRDRTDLLLSQPRAISVLSGCKAPARNTLNLVLVLPNGCGAGALPASGLRSGLRSRFDQLLQ